MITHSLTALIRDSFDKSEGSAYRDQTYVYLPILNLFMEEGLVLVSLVVSLVGVLVSVLPTSTPLSDSPWLCEGLILTLMACVVRGDEVKTA